MNIRYTILLFIVIHLIASSCNNKSKNPSDIEFSLDTIYTNIDYSSQNLLFQSMDKEIFNSHFSFWNKGKNEIVVVNIFDTTKSVEIPLDSFQQVSESRLSDRIGGYYFHNWDTILVLGFYSNKLARIDSTGSVKDLYNIPMTGTDSLDYDLNAYHCPPFISKDNVYISQHFTDTRYANNEVIQKIYFSSPIEITYSLVDRSKTDYNVYYPLVKPLINRTI